MDRPRAQRAMNAKRGAILGRQRSDALTGAAQAIAEVKLLARPAGSTCRDHRAISRPW
jgi:hypothetical protein